MTTVKIPPPAPGDPQDEVAAPEIPVPAYVPGTPKLSRGTVTEWLRSDRVRKTLTTLRLPRKKGPQTPLASALTLTFAALALIALWLLVFGLVISSLQHYHSQSVVYSKFRQELAEETAPLGGVISPGQPVALIDFPAAGMKGEVVVEGTSSGILEKGPGHLRNTPLPGQLGISDIMGRAKLFGGPFHAITSAKRGDPITITTSEGTSQYVVDRVVSGGGQIPDVAPGAGQLRLITAQSSGWRSGWAPSHAVYVVANLVSKPFVDPGGRLAAVPSSDGAMKGDTGALYLLVLWLPVLVAGGAGAVWAYDKWGLWQTWLVGVPVILAGLWGVSESALQLLPNLM